VANKVEFQLSLDDRKALEAVKRNLEKQNELQNKMNETGKKGTDSFDGVGESIGKVVGILGVAGGAGAAFEAVLATINERAAALNREAQKSLELGKQTAQSSGSFLANNPGMGLEEFKGIRQNVDEMLMQYPAQGEGANSMVWGALQSVVSDGANLTQSQRNEAVSEGLQLRTLDQSLDLNTTAGGIAAVMNSTGMGANEAQNALIHTQSSSKIQSFSGIASGASKLMPDAFAGKVNAVDAMAMMAYTTGAIQDPEGNTSAEAVGKVLRKAYGRSGELGEELGMDLENLSGLEVVQKIAGEVHAGNIDKSQQTKILSMIGEGKAGTMLNSIFNDGGERLGGFLDDFRVQDFSQGDSAADSLAVHAAGDPSAKINNLLRSQSTLADSARGMDEAGINNAGVRNALLEDMASRGISDRQMTIAGEVFDSRIAMGFTPASAGSLAQENSSGLAGTHTIGKFFRGVNQLYDSDDYGAGSVTTEAGREMPSQMGKTAAEFIEELIDKQAEAVRKGMSEALQENKSRQPLEAGQ